MSQNLSSIDFLNEIGINYTVKEFSPDTEKGAENVAKCFNKDPRSFIKTLVFAGKTGRLYLVMVGGDQNVDTKLLAAATNEEEIGMAHPDVIAEHLGFIIGSIPPFGLKNKITTLLEESLKGEPVVGVGAGQWGVEIFLSPDDLIAATNAKCVNLTTKFDHTNWEEMYLDEKYIPRVESASQVNKFDLLSNVFAEKKEIATVNGWVYNLRSSGKIIFFQFRDGTGDIQVIAEKVNFTDEKWNQLLEIQIESSVQFKGKIKVEPRSASGYEMQLEDFTIIQIAPEYPITKKEHGPDFLLDNRHLWVRSQKQRAIMKIRDEIFFSMTKFLREEQFTRVDTPIFQPVSCEDTSELFEINYFGDKMYLTQSGQLYCEAMEYALGRTYDFGPVFRAEKSKTRKHLIEFWMMDAELPFQNLDDLMDFEEKMIKYIIKDVLTNCQAQLKTLERDTSILQKYVDRDFVRIDHKDAIKLLNEKYNLTLSELDDIGAQEEAYLSEVYDMPVFVKNWPAEIKAFYMPKYVDGTMERVKSVDLIAAEGFGEICGGAEREFDYNKLLKILQEKGYPYQDYAWYMDLRKYGSIPHSGFGIGMERFVRFISGTQHIRESIPFPRMLNRYYP